MANVKKEKEAFLLQIGLLSTELENSQKQLEVSNKNGNENLNDVKMVILYSVVTISFVLSYTSV